MAQITWNLVVTNQAFDISLRHIDTISQDENSLANFLSKYFNALC